MRFLTKTTRHAGLVMCGFMSLAILGGSSAVTASSAPESVDSGLLPQAAIEAALIEQQSIPATISLPDMSPAPAPLREGRSLDAMVAANLGTQTADRDQECLAVGVYFESKSEALKGQLAVAEVMLNRARSGRFPSSVCGVLRQPGQFSFMRGNSWPAIDRNSQNWREAVAIARIAEADMADSGVGRALFFHATHVSPGWRLTRVATVGNHVFYR